MLRLFVIAALRLSQIIEISAVYFVQLYGLMVNYIIMTYSVVLHTD